MIFLKILFLFIGVLYSINVSARVRYKSNISASHMIMMTVGIVGFVVLQFNLYQ